MDSQLDRIEAKLDALLGRRPPRDCGPLDGPHTHGMSLMDNIPLRLDETPYETCYFQARTGSMVRYLDSPKEDWPSDREYR